MEKTGLSPSKEGVCPVDQSLSKGKNHEITTDSCPIKSNDDQFQRLAKEAAEAGCPVNHSAAGRQATETSLRLWSSRNRLVGAPDFPAAKKPREESDAAVVGDQFPDSKPLPDQPFPLSAVASASTIPKSSRAPKLPTSAGSPPVPSSGTSISSPTPLAPSTPGGPLVCDSTTMDDSTPKKEGGQETWTFPSQQRFYNAMTRKGYKPQAEDMFTVVSIHNTINEAGWREVMKYEALHKEECPTPTLLRFRGRPDDLSMKARLMMLTGAVRPYDRHDWIVDRCGKDVTYIIDFYDGQKTHPLDPRVPVHLDVRPAPTFGGIVDRLKMYFGWGNQTTSDNRKSGSSSTTK